MLRPAGRAEVERWAEEGLITPKCEISQDGGQTWLPAGELLDLKSRDPMGSQVEMIFGRAGPALGLRMLGLFLAGALVIAIVMGLPSSWSSSRATRCS